LSKKNQQTPEHKRLAQDASRKKNWKRWGPYLPARQWSTVREDYSKGGDSWHSFDYDAARSRVYRWGEDGLLGWCDRQCRIAVSPALWNGRDPHLKERLFGLTGPQGNHGEDVKELYYYLDATPTHSYCKARYRYPHTEFPYDELKKVNRARTVSQDEYEIFHTKAFDNNAFFDLDVEYAKASPNATLIRYTVHNRGDQTAPIWLLSQVWYRNVWKWGREGEDYGAKPAIEDVDGPVMGLTHPKLGDILFCWREPTDEVLFTDNETDQDLLFGVPNDTPWVKNAFHRYLVEGEKQAVNPDREGTKAALLYHRDLGPGESASFDFLLACKTETPKRPFGSFDKILEKRRREADLFYDSVDPGLSAEDRPIWRQAYAGLLWSKQFYFYAVEPWLQGDPTQPKPPAPHLRGRNQHWRDHLYNRDVILMPDTWEYPWYAAWDLAFHAYPVAKIDPELAKEQLLLMLREWYMHPNGQLPAYEFDFNDVNPPVHAWACLRVYRCTGGQDTVFLERAFHKLLLNFTWWVNREDEDGDNVFSGGFLGLDNIGVFDRSRFPEEMGNLKQADATGWMAFFGLRMLQMALELAKKNESYEDIASKFFEHFVAITDSVNSDCGKGLWCPEDQFYYDFLRLKSGRNIPLKVRSLVGLLPLIAVEILDVETLEPMPGFLRRKEWFLRERPGLAQHFTWSDDGSKLLLSLCPKDRLRPVIERMLDSHEFLSPFGIRSLSKAHEDEPFRLNLGRQTYSVSYEPGESQTGMFGGNSNWRGPIWFPINYLLIDALKRYHAFFGDSFKVRFPTREGPEMNLLQVARQLESRLVSLFRPNAQGIPAMPHLSQREPRELWAENLLFHEYFHADTGKGLGACHQTGWTSLVARCLEDLSV
jgi:Mannosylglycerate hydrolase MGH1-like glycoside hydrolase domain